MGARRMTAALLASGSLPAEDQSSAEDLLSRTRFPKWAFAFVGLTAAVIALLLILAIART